MSQSRENVAVSVHCVFSISPFEEEYVYYPEKIEVDVSIRHRGDVNIKYHGYFYSDWLNEHYVVICMDSLEISGTLDQRSLLKR